MTNTHNTTSKNIWKKPLATILSLSILAGMSTTCFAEEKYEQVVTKHEDLIVSQNTTTEVDKDRAKLNNQYLSLIEDFHQGFEFDRDFKEGAFWHVSDETYDTLENSNMKDWYHQGIARRMAVMRKLSLFPQPTKSSEEADIFCKLWKLKPKPLEFFKHNLIQISFSLAEKTELTKLKAYFNDQKKVARALAAKEMWAAQKSIKSDIPANYAEYLINLKTLKIIAENY